MAYLKWVKEMLKVKEFFEPIALKALIRGLR
jgi:hypothetical protein